MRMPRPPNCLIAPKIKRAFGSFGGFTCAGGGSSATRDTPEKAYRAWHEQYLEDQKREKKS